MIVIFFIFLCFGAVASELPLMLEADVLTYSHNEKRLLAKGNVKITQKLSQNKQRILYADEICYCQKNNDIEVMGNVRLHEGNGDVVALSAGHLSDDFKKGLARQFYIITKDEARFSAVKAKRKNGCFTTFRQGTYTPCQFCKADALEPPLWQMRASEIKHDQEAKMISYKNARLEIKGIPVLYIPYFSHPDPSVKRQSGLLAPVIGYSKDFGLMTSAPAYYVIGPNRDMTLTPLLLQKQNPVIIGEYRHRFYDGLHKTAVSYTKTKRLNTSSRYGEWNGPRPPHENRWHVMSQTQYDMADDKRLTLDVSRASDTTYLSRYPINRQMPRLFNDRNLTSKFAFERFGSNSYFSAKSFAFQTDAPKTTPIVVPWLYHHKQISPEKIGGLVTIESNFLSLSRQTLVPGRLGTQFQRGSSGIEWKRQWILPGGQTLLAQGKMRSDIYYTRRYYYDSAVAANNPDRTLDRTTARLFPQSSLRWGYPLIQYFSGASWYMEPQAMVVASPQKFNNRHIPNEDSNTFELDDTTLFLPNRFNGIDKVDAGQRAIYGVDNTWRFEKGRMINFFVGQSRRLDHRQVVDSGWGETQNASDIITRLKIMPASWFSVRHRAAFPSNKGGTPRYSEYGMALGPAHLQLDLAHTYLSRSAAPQQESVSQTSAEVKSQISDHWGLSVAQIRNLNKNSGQKTFANFLSTTYQDECFKMSIGVYKTGYADRDVRPDSGFLVQLSFKNIGGFTPTSAPSFPGSILTSFK